MMESEGMSKMSPDMIQRLRLLYSDSNWYDKIPAARFMRHDLDVNRTEDTAADLFDSILTPVLQLVRRKISETLVEKGQLTKGVASPAPQPLPRIP